MIFARILTVCIKWWQEGDKIAGNTGDRVTLCVVIAVYRRNHRLMGRARCAPHCHGAKQS